MRRVIKRLFVYVLCFSLVLPNFSIPTYAGERVEDIEEENLIVEENYGINEVVVGENSIEDVPELYAYDLPEGEPITGKLEAEGYEWSYYEDEQTLVLEGDGRGLRYDCFDDIEEVGLVKHIRFNGCGFDDEDIISMFSGWSELESVVYNSCTFSKVMYINSMFNGCSNLKSVNFSDSSFPNVTELGGMFRQCSKLENVNFSGSSFPNVTRVQGLFNGCSNLKSVNFSDSSFPNATSMQGLFGGCSELENVNFSDSSFPNVTNVRSMFSGCSNLKSADFCFSSIGNVNAGGMFINCSELVEVNFGVLSNVTNMDFMFWGCSNLGSVDFSGLNLTNVKNMNSMFWGCSNLGSVDFRELDLANVEDMNSMFWGCSNLGGVDFSGLNLTNVKNMNSMFWGCSNLESVDFEGSGISDVVNMGQMFYQCRNLESVDFRGLSLSNVTDMNSMFSGCSNLESVDFEGSGISDVVNMGQMFYQCRNLESVDFRGLSLSNVTDMNSMFWGCRNLESVDFEGSGISDVVNMGKMFYQCRNLESVDFRGSSFSNVTDLNSIFYGCSSLKQIATGESLKEGMWIELPYEFRDSEKNIVTSIHPFHCNQILTKVGEYYITYYLNGGENSSGNPDTYTEVTSNIILQNPKKTGYSFDGWYSDREFTTPEVQIPQGSRGDKAFHAKWIANQYNIVFNGNGNTDGSMAGINVCEYGKSYTLPDNEFKRAGYRFVGWNTKADGSGTAFADGEGLKDLTSENGETVTLYAQWEMVTYYITYRLNGGKNRIENPSSYRVTTETIYLEEPEKTGYTFAGWYSDSDFNTLETQIPKGSTGDKILYAKWIANQYNIVFNGNGNTDGSMAGINDCEYGKSYTLPDNGFERTGYTFAGWNTKADGSGTAYTGGSEVTDLTAVNGKNVVLYAQWEPVTYTITYDLNGGTNNADNPSSYCVTTETIYLEVPTRTGYNFVGWYSDNDFNVPVTMIPKGRTGDRTFYAKWKAVDYTITYKLNGGTNSSANPSGYCIEAETVHLEEPEKTGYTFDGWYSDSNFTTPETQIPQGSMGNKTFYAKWAVNQYNIAFHGNGSTGGSMESLNDCEYGKSYTLWDNEFEKNGYTFVGWNTKADGSGTAYADGSSVTELTSENGETITLYAQWKPVTYFVTYHLNGGKNRVENPSSYLVTTETIYLEEPEKSGYTFDGWYSDFITMEMQIPKGSIGDKVLYAKWTANKYNIVFKGNRNTGGSMESLKGCEYGKSYTLPDNEFEKNGYTFVGWNTKADGRGNDYAAGEGVKSLTATNGKNVILYAQWELVTYSITYDLDGGMNHADNPSSYCVITETIYLENPIRTGYTFAGWYSDSNFTFLATMIPKGRTGNKTFYAKWAVNKYNIVFHGNGSTGGSMAGINDCEYGKSYTLPDNEFERTGYTFVGWNTKEDGSGSTYADRSSVTNLTAANGETVTLYAQWDKIGQVEEPCASVPTNSMVNKGTKITLTCADAGAKIYYTLDGTLPTKDSILYTEPIVIMEETMITAIAVKEEYRDSEVVVFEYNVYSTEEILPDDIPDGLWIDGVEEEYQYTGIAIKPQVRVYNKEQILVEGKDYTVSYKNNVNVNDPLKTDKTPTIVVKGKGNFTGTETKNFNIVPVALTEDTIAMEPIILASNNKVQKPVPIVTFNGKKLKNKKDFTISYTELEQGKEGANKVPGTYEIVVSAVDKGNFSGSQKVSFTITEKILMSKVKVAKIPNQFYSDWEGKPVEPSLTVTMSGKTQLIKGTDYKVEFVNNESIGTATAILTGLGEYTGTKKVTFKITGNNIKSAEVTGLKNVVYNGNNQELKPVVTFKENTLTEGNDYTISYTPAVNVGKVTVTITGINSFTGSIKKTYNITSFDLKADWSKDKAERLVSGLEEDIDVKYVKGGAKPVVKLFFAGVELEEGKDYKVSYKNNTNVTTSATKSKPVLTIKGMGNFKGSFQKNFNISSKSLDDAEFPVAIAVADMAYANKAGKFMSKPVLTDVDGKVLKAGTDYDTVYFDANGKSLTKQDKPEVGSEITIQTKGKGNYNGGVLTATYKITSLDFTKAKISINPQEFTGKPIYLTKDDIKEVKINGVNIKDEYGTSYEIVEDSYKKNDKKGTATVTIRGLGNYGGSKTVTFKINAKKFVWFWKLFG